MSQRMSVQSASPHLTLEVIHLGERCNCLQQEESALPFPGRPHLKCLTRPGL